MSCDNLPPGVTGAEFEIAGPDMEELLDDFNCPSCGSEHVTLFYYGNSRWSACDNCEWASEAEYGGDDE